MEPLEGKRVLITGGTGSLGKVLTKRILSGEMGKPEKVIIYSRDEAKQHFMRMKYHNIISETDELLYNNFKQLLEFRIGDIRNYSSIASVLQDVDVVFNTAALKQVPSCEYFPYEAVRTNLTGPENIVRAIHEHNLPIETVIGISTDKACKPVNVMGMTKAIQERLLIQGNLRCRDTKFIFVRYGNVLASRGSVIPVFHSKITNGGPVTVTHSDMTRFLLSLDEAVDLIYKALLSGKPGDIYIPQIRSAKILTLAEVLIADRDIEIQITGIRPGEKIHEILISEEESHFTIKEGDYYVIRPLLPELREDEDISPAITNEYSSKDHIMNKEELYLLLKSNMLLVEQVQNDETEEMFR